MAAGGHGVGLAGPGGGAGGRGAQEPLFALFLYIAHHERSSRVLGDVLPRLGVCGGVWRAWGGVLAEPQRGTGGAFAIVISGWPGSSGSARFPRRISSRL